MKRIILLDTTFMPSYDEYVDYCEVNEVIPQPEDSEAYWDYVNEARYWEVEDFEVNLRHCKENDAHYWVISGVVGLWYGSRDIVQTMENSLLDAICKCWGGCDDVIVEKLGSVIYVTAMHHDGRNKFEIRALSGKGAERLNRLGEVSLTNRENIVTLPKYLY